ncbi:hypothetical protein Syun_026684 [Stephania yunnanensis]|uniref:Pectinesterase n=1 Tax=Stephania yunnanensis TaxID=152371 RepID=A0AAP0F2X9_9MAGN
MSFLSYGKVDHEFDQQLLEARQKTRKRIAIIAVSTLVLIGIIVGAAVGATRGGKSKSNVGDPAALTSISESIKAICNLTLHPDSCYTSLSSSINNDTSRIDPEQIFKLSVEVALSELSKVAENFMEGLEGMNDKAFVAALGNCKDLLGLALDHLNTSMFDGNSTLIDAVDDLRTWLSAAGTYQQTCIDGFQNVTQEIWNVASQHLNNSTQYTSNSLAIITGISNFVTSFKLRRLMSYEDCDHGFPDWASRRSRELKQMFQTPVSKIKADVVVAKDGSGNYMSITAALKAVPEKSKKRFVIYVKKGVYYENVRVEKSMWNVTMIGDGMNATIVSGSLNFIDGTPTFSSATFAVFGKGFFARDMGFQNTAGPAKHQAVALMASADECVFYRCQVDAFQDTLYAHAQRQFFKECVIRGTVDFIFGNAAVILQNCSILPKLPMLGQQNTITAQGKIDPNQNTGIVIQNCTISPFGNLSSVATYLGRPWKPYSTTLYMRSWMDGFIHPAGWLPWNGTTAPDTIFYSEFENYGPGSSMKYRVKWKGLKNITVKQASQFTVKAFLKGDKWISNAGFKYASNL